MSIFVSKTSQDQNYHICLKQYIHLIHKYIAFSILAVFSMENAIKPLQPEPKTCIWEWVIFIFYASLKENNTFSF